MVGHRSNEASKRLDDIPGVGPALATALVASVADPKAFRSGRDFSAWIGLANKIARIDVALALKVSRKDHPATSDRQRLRAF
jgi:transposase